MPYLAEERIGLFLIEDLVERLTEQLRGRHVKERRVRRRDLEVAPLPVDLEDNIGHGLEDRTQLGFGGPQPLLGLLALRDVEDESLPVERLARLIAHDDRIIFDPYYPSIAGNDAVFLAKGLARGTGAPALGHQALPVVRVNDLHPVVGVLQVSALRVSEHGLYLR